jgi:hypothetical protein
MNLENFIEKSKRIHGDKFDYSKFEYIGSKNKSILICNTCNVEFLTTPTNNLIGTCCKNCFIIKRSLEHIKEKLIKKYSSWSFDFTDYKNSDSIIKYVCENRHDGKSNYRNMIRFNVCKECNKLDLIKRNCKKIIRNNLEIIEYKSDDLIKCRCNKCGFNKEDSLLNLTYNNYKCKYCILLNESTLLKDGTIKLIKIGDFGDSKNIYLECNKGHKYTQDRNNLLSNRGCNQCRKEKITFSKEHVFSKFSEIHGDLYKYKYDDYISVKSKIEITCRKGHIFFQKVSNHLQGKGCPICRESIGERNISVYLENKSIKFIRQKKFSDCKYISHLPFDFYIPSINTIIEYDGIQHFEPVELFGGLEEFEKTKIKDKIKNEYCSINNIKLYRISYKDIITDTLDLIFN